ncbi:hypothetical protein [Pendulispora albinea]|uniref:Uncharacterized protein n=1 Tax=Pendulispora albinea TaxID=2741071 RepID=A0ABZ2LYD2_9BACT
MQPTIEPNPSKRPWRELVLRHGDRPLHVRAGTQASASSRMFDWRDEYL